MKRTVSAAVVVSAALLIPTAAPVAVGAEPQSAPAELSARAASGVQISTRAARTARTVRTRIRGWSTRKTYVNPGRRLRDRIRVVTGNGNRKRRVVLLRKKVGAAKWRRLSVRKTTRSGRMTVRFKAPKAGSWNFRIRVRPSGKAKAVRSRVHRVVVRKPAGIAPPAPSASRIFVAGDIGRCGGAADETAALIRADQGSVVVPGDVAYPNGTAADFANCYHPDYGRFRNQTYPVPGNHEYNSGAAGYFGYFGNRVGTLANPWYAVNIGSWRFYMLNSNCDEAGVGGCEVGSPQYTWLWNQLRASNPQCTAVVWHHPRWSSGQHGPYNGTQDLYTLLDNYDADLLLTGHEHNYERFVAMNKWGVASADGIREFVVGTGGQDLRSFPGGVAGGSQKRLNDSHGVLMMDLTAGGYSWNFLPTKAGAGTDSGSGACR